MSPPVTPPIPNFNPETVQQLTLTLTQLASSDSAVLSQAEEHLNSYWIASHPDILLAGLVYLLRTNGDAILRSFAAILYRRIALKPMPSSDGNQSHTQLQFVVSPATRQYCLDELLSALAKEPVSNVRRKLCDTIAEVAKAHLLRNEPWQKLLPVMFDCVKSPQAEFRESAYRIFTSVPRLIAGGVIDMSAVKPIFENSLSAQEVKEVRVAALRAAVTFLLEANTSKSETAQQLMLSILNVLPPLSSEGDEDNLSEAFSSLIELAESLPKLFRPIMGDLLMFVMQILKNGDLENSTRQTALELLLSIADAAPSMVRKQTPNFCQEVIPICFQMMAELDDDPSWATTDDLEDDDETENYVVGEQAMDRIARSLGGKSVIPVSFALIPQMLGSQAWQQRHAALMAVSAIGEGCQKFMEPELGKVLQMIIPFIRDPHIRVRYATCNALGQLATDFEPILQQRYHAQVLPALITAMTDEHRVQAHAAAALVNFAEHVAKKDILPYLDTIFDKLVALLQQGKIYVQEQAITTIATVADSAEDQFAKYYGSIMPWLISILREAKSAEFRLLRGKAMECASLIALAVGKDVFGPDAKSFLDLIMEIQKAVTEPDDPQSSYLLAVWARMCKVLGQDFIPYLPYVMPPLLHSASLKPDIAILDPEESADDYSPDEGWEFATIEGQKLGINTTVLEEKCTAVEMLICYARELGPGFTEYSKQVMDLVVPLLKFYFHDGVRHAAAACVTQVLGGVVKAGSGYPRDIVTQMWQTACQMILSTITNELDPDFVLQLYVTFSDCVETLGEGCLNSRQMEMFTNVVDATLVEFMERLNDRDKRRKDADFDAEEEEALEDEAATEDAVLSEVTKSIHFVLKTHGATFLPYLEKLIPTLTTYLNDHRSEARQVAICVYDDVIEFTGALSLKYSNVFLGKLLDSILDPNQDVRQAACYGAGLAAMKGGDGFSDFCAAALPNLFRVLQGADARSETNVMASENAISAIAKICRYNHSKFDVNSVIPSWIEALPIRNDQEEAEHVYGFLIELIKSGHPAVGTHLSKVVSAVTDALVLNFLPQTLTDEAVNTLKRVLVNVSESVRGELWKEMDESKRALLSRLL
ncbi:armadillo-type protein [Paraphysoderma sedebokerense]|nr:armadillo-type protein [Paraphysoderma sedebokerense]